LSVTVTSLVRITPNGDDTKIGMCGLLSETATTAGRRLLFADDTDYGNNPSRLSVSDPEAEAFFQQIVARDSAHGARNAEVADDQAGNGHGHRPANP
jgi:hypothetical protein